MSGRSFSAILKMFKEGPVSLSFFACILLDGSVADIVSACGTQCCMSAYSSYCTDFVVAVF